MKYWGWLLFSDEKYPSITHKTKSIFKVGKPRRHRRRPPNDPKPAWRSAKRVPRRILARSNPVKFKK